jgi:hypothetical protein
MRSIGGVAIVTLQDDDACGNGLNTGSGTTLAFGLLDALTTVNERIVPLRKRR